MLNYQPTLDRVFHALSDPTRRAIVDRLARGEASVCELAAPFDMSLPAVHQHVSLLEGCGLIASSKTGRVRTCRLEARTLQAAQDWLAGRRMLWERRLDALARFVARETEPSREKNRKRRTT